TTWPASPISGNWWNKANWNCCLRNPPVPWSRSGPGMAGQTRSWSTRSGAGTVGRSSPVWSTPGGAAATLRKARTDRKGGTEMNQRDEAKLLEQLEQWNEKDEFSRCIQAIEAIPERERGYLLTVMLSRAYSNLAVLGDHSTHGEDDEVDGNLIRHAIELLESVRAQGEGA